MYIKQIIIQGFKSYKDQTVIEPFSPKHNVIVGRNGSGKSNFFAAIQFVLSDRYTQMGREDRAALLHEGAGSAVMSAYVELIFDNADQRFPTDTPEVTLRRTIGQKKDEYSLNRKNTTKQEVVNMLETAGFSRSNPYYIVPQGRITALTNAKDHERLSILKEVAGTTVYDQRRAESQKLMAETDHKRAKIDLLLGDIDGRLGELEEEKEELRAYQDTDRERRCLEYTIHRRDQDAYQEALDKLEEEREGGVERADEDRERLEQSEVELERIDAEVEQLQTQLKLQSDERARLEDERKDAAKQMAKIELDVQTMTDDQAAAQQARTQHDAELREVRTQLQRREAELAALLPEYQRKTDQERALRQQIADTDGLIDRLYAKQGRQSQFRTRRERDDYLRSEIGDIHLSLAARKAVVMQHDEEIAELEQQIQQLQADIADMRSRIENRGAEQRTISGEVARAKEERDRLHDHRKELWREEAKLDSILESARAELNKAEKFLSQMMDQSTSRGLAAVRDIVRKHAIAGCHGTLGELFEYNDKYKTAVEVTAGTSLFHYVVDTDETAARIVAILQKEKRGRVTFMPLSRLRPRTVDFPAASDALPLISKLKFDPRFEKAFQQVFGKTIVCPNVQVASQYARSHQVNAITPDGDRADKKGAMSGGYFDLRSSRTDGLRREQAARAAFTQHSERKAAIRSELEKVDQQVTKAMSELQKAEQRRMQMEGGYGPLREELRRREMELDSKHDELDRKKRQREQVAEDVRSLGEQLRGHEQELHSEFRKTLSDEEERQLADLNARLPELRKQYSDISAERSELESRKRIVELEIRDNLRRRLEQLESEDADGDAARGSSASPPARLRERQRDLERITQALDAVRVKLDKTEQALDAAQQQLGTAQQRRAAAAQRIDELHRAIAHHQKTSQKSAAKRAALTARLAEVGTLIRQLGALPDVAFGAPYSALLPSTATARLHAVQEALKRYGHVNKKAFEQFTQFERQREVLLERERELERSGGSIRELIAHLDQRKDEAIERTFRQVSAEFQRIFERLVPAGRGRLVIQRRSDTRADSEDEAAGAPDRPGRGVDAYVGVSLAVSFTSKHDDQQRLPQLSGGQKSLCALALVLAIQASDPAPFYLFDEIDAALDAQYRAAVAELLRDGAATAQFICTTFRPEMLRVADKCYGVSYLGKASAVDVVSREQAVEFVEGVMGGK